MSITIRTTWTDSISPAAIGNKVYRNDIEIQDLGMGVEVWDDATAEYDIQYKYEIQAYSIDDETVQEVDNVNVFHILIPTPNITKLVTITTDSVSSTWTPSNITNTGDTLIWEVTGGVTIGEVTNNNPIFDLSGNTGIATITIKSTSEFIGFTELKIDTLDILTTDVIEAIYLIHFSCKANTGYTDTDVSTLVNLESLTVRSDSLTSLDISTNTSLTQLWCYANFITTLDLSTNTELILVYAYTNSLSDVELDQIVIDLNNHGKLNGELYILGNSGNLTTDSYSAYQSLTNKGWDIDVDSPEQPSYTELAPVLSEFTISDTNTDRIYFTSSEYITGTTSTGFIIDGVIISNVIIVPNSFTGHYFTVSVAFTHFNNNAIRYTTGSNIADLNSQTVYSFDPIDILNNISEPVVSDHTFYTDGSVALSGDGLSEVNAFKTIQEGLDAIDAEGTPEGSTLWVKAYNYGNVSNTFIGSGTAIKPIKILGYKTTVDDNPILTRTIGMSFNATEMPLLSGAIASITSSGDYVIFKNIQIDNSSTSDTLFSVDTSNYNIIESCYVSGGQFGFWAYSTTNGNTRITNSYSANASESNVTLRNNNNLIDDVWSVSSVTTSDTNNYIAIFGGETGYSNIIRNCFIDRIFDNIHVGIGIMFKNGLTASTSLEYSLIQNNTINKVNQSIVFAYSQTQYCISRSNQIAGTGDRANTGGLVCSDGAQNNIHDSNFIFDTNIGIYMKHDGEDTTTPSISANNNTFRNNVFDDINIGITVENESATINKIHNCTFNDCDSLSVIDVVTYPNASLDINNVSINSIVTNSGTRDTDDDMSWTYSCFYNNAFTIPVGTGNINTDPIYVDEVNSNFRISNLSPATISQGGTITSAIYDADASERLSPYSIGAYEYNAVNTSIFAPIIYNFRIDNINKDRIYFDSSKLITATTITGFYLGDSLDKTINGITIVSDSTFNHYFTVSSDFTYWDNNTIRYEGGSNLNDLNYNALYNFTLQYIDNNIVEPTATDHTFYVDGSVSSSGDGSSEAQAFKTIGEGMTAVNNEASSEGSTVWIKAYDYGDAPFVVGSNGTIDKPIKIIGYETSTGGVPDLIDSNYFNYSVGLNFDSTKMPLIKETIIGTNSGMSISSKSNIIIKNLQFSSYYHNLLISNGSNVLVENCNSELATHGSDSGGNFDSHDRDNINIRFKYCIGVNGDMASFRVYGDYNLIENCQAYADLEVSYSSDYYFRLNGSNNIIRNSHCSKVQPTISIGKGYSVKGSDNVVDEFCKYNLVEKCTAENMTLPLQVSHSDSEYNVFKDCDITGINDGKSNGVIGLFCTANNIFERITSDNYNGAVLYIGETTEDNAYAYGSHDNIIRNSIFKSGGAIVRVTTGTRESFNNKLINCTFDDHYYLEYNSELMNGINNEFINCIIQGAGHSLYTAQWEFSYTNTWDSWLSNGTPETGTGNISVDPQFIPNSFIPTEKLLIAGTTITNVVYDIDKIERVVPYTIGAYRIRTRPVLSNFHIQNSYPDRVYFNSSDTIGNLSIQGFIVSGKTIDSIYINQYQLTGHYFTVTVAFDFWDNNTIRLESGDDTVYNFDLTYIVNRISEPTATDHTFYVDGLVSSSGNGLSEANAFKTIEEGITAINNEASSEGSTLWVKAYDYGSENVIIGSSGTSTKPIKILGYKTSNGGVPDIINSNYYNYTTSAVLSSSEMPYIKSSIQYSGIGVKTDNRSFIIIKNFQSEDYLQNFDSNNSDSILFENCNSFEGVGGLNGQDRDNIRLRYINCISVNANTGGLRVFGDYHLFDNCEVYCDSRTGNSTDYYLRLNGSNSIIKDCHVAKGDNVVHTGHGYTIKSTDNDVTVEPNEYNLILNSSANSIKQTIQFTSVDTKYNVVRGFYGTSEDAIDEGNAITLAHASNNIFENCEFILETGSFIVFYGTTDEDRATLGAQDNIIKNCVFKGVQNGSPSTFAMRVTQDASNRSNNNNEIINCTFSDIDYWYYNTATLSGHTGNKIINSIVNNITNEPPAGVAMFTFEYSNHWDWWGTNGVAESGTGNISVNPYFIDLINFVPQNTALKAGIKIINVNYDKKGEERNNTPTMGVEEI